MIFRKVLTMLSLLIALAFLMFSNAHADNYGAIAYSQAVSAHGYSYNYASQLAAENRALNECERHSGMGDCKILVWFKNGCGALAEGAGGYGSGWGANRRLAERYALQSCSQYAYNCRITRWVCTD